MYLNKNLLFWLSFVTAILLFISIPIQLCMCCLHKSFLVNLLISCMTCTLIPAIVALITYQFERKRNIKRIAQALVYIRHCLVHIDENSRFAENGSNNYELCKYDVCHFCKKILIKCELIRDNELYNEVLKQGIAVAGRKQKVFDSFDMILSWAYKTKKGIRMEKSDEQSIVINLKHHASQLAKDAEEMTLKFVGMYCAEDKDKIIREFFEYSLDSQPSPALQREVIAEEQRNLEAQGRLHAIYVLAVILVYTTLCIALYYVYAPK